jgi:hypothetical protein
MQSPWIRRSLKTTDKELARRRLADLRQKVGRLSSDSAKKLPFAEYRVDEKTGEPTKDLLAVLPTAGWSSPASS